MKKILFTLIILSLQGCSTTRIVDPSPTDVPSSFNIGDVYSAIMLSLQGVPPDTGSGEKIASGVYESLAKDIDAENLSWHHEDQDGNVIHAG